MYLPCPQAGSLSHCSPGSGLGSGGGGLSLTESGQNGGEVQNGQLHLGSQHSQSQIPAPECPVLAPPKTPEDAKQGWGLGTPIR